ncbi:unnamed protein product [Strongylus vulgaris]|uniref:Reverse transcriptase domain-containing protein n=1 Tax=Strongylus vulgaris TaxID=40348 RepID=A0A3P7KQN9_STRVU|nr:unnamed protein product [Strongylus vulgaris]
MESITKRFYTNLSLVNILVKPVLPTGEIPPRILPTEIRAAIQTMKAATASRPDHVSADLLPDGHRLHEILAEHLTSYLLKERIPDRTFLLHKKGDREDLCPICLLSVFYKLFMRIIPARIRTLDEAQPVKQAGFCQGFSCWIPREAKRARGRPPTRWADVFVARMNQLNSQQVTSSGPGPRERRRRTLIQHCGWR